MAGRMGQASLYITAPRSLPSHHPRAENRRQLQRSISLQGLVGGTGSPALGTDAAGAAFDLAVYVQQARVVALGLLCADLRDRGPMAVGLMTESQLSPPSSQSSLLGLPTHRPLGNVIRPDVGPTGGWLFTGPGSSGQIEQNKRLGYPSLPYPPVSQKAGPTAGCHS